MNRDESYLFDMAKFCRTILRLTENMTEADFEQDERTQLAVLYEITIIGEVVISCPVASFVYSRRREK